MNSSSTLRISAACAALLAIAGCGSLDGLTSREGQLTGAGAGALVGAVASGGILVPVIGAVSGAVIGEELAEPDPLLD